MVKLGRGRPIHRSVSVSRLLHDLPLADRPCAGVVQPAPARTARVGRVVRYGRALATALPGIRNVTGRHRLTAELESERDRRRAAEQMAGLGYWELDMATGAVQLSDGTLRLLGTRGPKTMDLNRLLARFAAADRSRLTAALQKAAATVRGVAEHECDLHGLDGVRRRVLMRSVRSCSAAGRAVITGTIFDITRLREAERARSELQAMFAQGFEGSPIGMSVTDPRTDRFLRVNPALATLVGRDREELLSLSFHDVTHPDDAAADEQARTVMVDGGVAHHEREKRYLRPDGSVVWVSVHTAPVFGAGGEVRAFFSQVVDLTARREREDQLKREASDLERLSMIRAALADDRLVLHAQPIVDLDSGETVQRELLVRLRDEDGGLVPPGDFLPVAERYGLIPTIDQWVTRQAVELAAAGIPVAVNLSAASMGDDILMCAVREALERTGADPSLVVFEVTETALMANLAGGRRFADAVRAFGCRFALDDFGTGYGTFTYLKHLPVDYLKIDIEFVRDLLRSHDDERLVQAIVRMARDLGKTTIAEGVEDATTLQRLRELGVDQAQGFHLGRPAEVRVAALPAG